MISSSSKEETVVLLDAHHHPIGTMAKRLVHHHQTPLHLAFSCYIRNAEGDILITRRALSKKAWPGVWTNSVCGHPAPNEAMTSAVARRARFELGLPITDITMRVPDFSYCERDASGIVEHEFCPVFTAQTSHQPAPNPQEVMDYYWCPVQQLLSEVNANPAAFSPWMVQQLATEQLLTPLAHEQPTPLSMAGSARNNQCDKQ